MRPVATQSDLAGGLFGGGGDCWFYVGSGGSFVTREIEIGAEGVEDHHGKLGAEAVEFVFAPVPIQARRSGNVFGECLTVIAFADQDVSQQSSSVNIVNAAAGLAVSVGQAEEDFAVSRKFGLVIPSLGRIDLRMMPLGPVNAGLLIDEFFLGVEIKNALARVAHDGLRAGTNLVVRLRTQHDAACHTLLIAHLRNPAAPELRHPLVVA